MSPGSFVRRSLRHHRRIHLAVACGVAVAVAVIAGALAVGDSLRGTLRALSLERLAGAERIVLAPGFFREKLLAETLAGRDLPAAAIVLLPATLEAPAGERRAAGVTVLGVENDNPFFPDLGLELRRNDLALTARLAEELGVAVGDDVLLRVGLRSEIPAESALGRKTETVGSRRMTVAKVVPARGSARFALSPSQQAAKNAWVARSTLQQIVDEPGRVNVLLFGRGGHELALRPTLDDFGLALRHERGYWQLTSRSLLLPDAASAKAKETFPDRARQSAFTYLANRLTVGDFQVPYSTITAVELPAAGLPPLRKSDGSVLESLADGEIALGAWAAEQLQAKVGDALLLEYFEPETTHGEARETTAVFTVAAILAEDEVSTDPAWTPELPGVTDQLTIADWSPPFPFDVSRVRKEDEEYWDEYRAAPKAFVSLATGRKHWASRFGDTTALRFSEAGSDMRPERLAAALDPATLSWQDRNVRAEQLRASAGTTPFEGLFLGFSLFLIAAALMLVALLARLGVERRAPEVGLLLASGIRRKTVRRWVVAEAALVAAAGATLGLPLAVLYAKAMLWGLTTLWRGAVRTDELQLHVSPTSLAIGWIAGLVASLAAAWWAARAIDRYEIRPLLSGRVAGSAPSARRLGRASWITAGVCGVVAAAAIAAGMVSRGEAQIGSFFAAGAVTLVAALALTGGSIGAVRRRGLSLRSLAQASAAANPTRGTLASAMVATSVFLIAAIGAFRLDPAETGPALDSGNGGFALIADSDQPIFADLDAPAARSDLGFSREADEALSATTIYEMRVEPGDDASCLNLYQVARPRIVGVGSDFVARGGFEWAATAATTPEQKANPWRLLDQALPAEDGTSVVAVVIDQATAYYSLHLWGGVGETIRLHDGAGRPLQLRVVGLLKNSVLQGELLIGEQDFLRHFPEAEGFRRFLIDCPAGNATEVSGALEQSLGDYGFDVATTQSRLGEFFAVQNTYLTTFQGLGALGLFLGACGLAVVQVRNALERRGELALMKAIGWRPSRIAALVLWETAVVLARGVVCGLLGAAVALAPQWMSRAAGLPWQATLLAIGAVVVAGVVSGWIGARAALKAEILPALRGS